MKSRRPKFKGFRRTKWREYPGGPERSWREGEPPIRVRARQIQPAGAAPGGVGPEPLRRPREGGRVPDTMPEPYRSAWRKAWLERGKRSSMLKVGVFF